MAKRFITKQFEIERRRSADRAARIAAMTEKELAAWMVDVARELDDNSMDIRLKANHTEIRDQIRAELAARRQPVAA